MSDTKNGVEIRERVAQIIHDHTHQQQGVLPWAELVKLGPAPQGYCERRAYALADKLISTLSPHQGPETRGQGAGREGEGRDPKGSDYSAEPEPARGLGPSGEYSSREADAAVLERRTTEVARRYGCDRGTFTVCWGEHERGEICRCKEEARAELAPVDRSPQGRDACGSVGDESAVTGAAGQAPNVPFPTDAKTGEV